MEPSSGSLSFFVNKTNPEQVRSEDSWAGLGWEERRESWLFGLC